MDDTEHLENIRLSLSDYKQPCCYADITSLVSKVNSLQSRCLKLEAALKELDYAPWVDDKYCLVEWVRNVVEEALK